MLAALLLAACGHEGPPNVLLVSLDTFRADRVGALGNPDGRTPNLDRLAAEGVAFTRAYAQATVTTPSHTSLLTSRYPSEFAGSTRAPNLPPEMYTLAEVLGAYDYQSAARVAGGDLSPEIGPVRGFDSYETAPDFASLYHTVPMALDWLDARDPSRPFFLFVHSYDTHAPYPKPGPFGLPRGDADGATPWQKELLDGSARIIDGRFHPGFELLDQVSRQYLAPRSAEARLALTTSASAIRPPLPKVTEADQALVRDAYDGAVAYADAWLGLLLARLEARDLLDDTVIVVVADHGEVLGEGGLYHRCCTLGDEVARVPLIVRLPGGEGGGRVVDVQVELVDVMPTVLSLVGAAPPAGIRGASLVPALRGEPYAGRPVAFTQGGVGYRMLSARSPAGRLTYTGVPVAAEPFDALVAAAQIPGPTFESTDGMGVDEAEALRKAMIAWEQGLRHPTTDTGAETPAELREQLRARGYWDAR